MAASAGPFPRCAEDAVTRSERCYSEPTGAPLRLAMAPMLAERAPLARTISVVASRTTSSLWSRVRAMGRINRTFAPNVPGAEAHTASGCAPRAVPMPLPPALPACPGAGPVPAGPRICRCRRTRDSRCSVRAGGSASGGATLASSATSSSARLAPRSASRPDLLGDHRPEERRDDRAYAQAPALWARGGLEPRGGPIGMADRLRRRRRRHLDRREGGRAELRIGEGRWAESVCPTEEGGWVWTRSGSRRSSATCALPDGHTSRTPDGLRDEEDEFGRLPNGTRSGPGRPAASGRLS